MNKETLKSIKKQVDKYRHDILFCRGTLETGDFDDKGAWMLVLTFMDELIKYELDKQRSSIKGYT